LDLVGAGSWCIKDGGGGRMQRQLPSTGARPLVAATRGAVGKASIGPDLTPNLKGTRGCLHFAGLPEETAAAQFTSKTSWRRGCQFFTVASADGLNHLSCRVPKNLFEAKSNIQSFLENIASYVVCSSLILVIHENMTNRTNYIIEHVFVGIPRSHRFYDKLKYHTKLTGHTTN
jgi:hypothetical protein